MFYKFNSMIGRLASSSRMEAYMPQGLTPSAREPSQIIFDSKKTKPVHEPAVTATRPATSMATPLTNAEPGKTPGGIIPADPAYRKIQEMQNLFLKQDGLMVWQKLSRDRAAYTATMGVTVLGLLVAVSTIYTLAFPQKKD